MPTLKVSPAAAVLPEAAAEEETAALEAVLEAAPPQPVSAIAETAEAARAAFRKLRREIMFRFFIVVTPFPERAANQKTRSLCGTGLKTKRPCPCVLSTRTGSVNYDSAVPPCLLCIQYSRATHGEPTLPCPVTETSVQSYWGLCPFARPSAAHETLPRFRPFALSGLTADALCRFSSASSV